VGLAGPQAGWNARIVTLDVEGEKKGRRIYVNPRIISAEGSESQEEGCLSLPEVWVPISRAERVVVKAYTIRGEQIQIEAEGLHARAWQHEIDHLNGTLIIDRVEGELPGEASSKLQELEEKHAAPAG
jgi:peptide deformylase